MVFPGVAGNTLNVLMEVRVLDLVVLFVCTCLCSPALCTLLAITSSLPFLKIPGWASLFPGSFTIFTQPLSLQQPHFTLCHCCRFFVCCLCSCVCFFSWYPGMIFRTETKMEQLGFSTCRSWCPGAGFRLHSEVHPPGAHRGYSVQGADWLSVMHLR